ncbi:hypothetical protein [Anaerobium acetethylicum]|uniref:Uncharacterized protein n=1 Tax=Anaerobium acetethylicum TaxID=1619234 RepID=A0A1D3TV46_9FIRM|nr:hypothetical protein [Anaerobium acetethylicum]SCP97996.1 hypothetical protein SAMN05421730_101569 [Anaerobium acetethylicum]
MITCINIVKCPVCGRVPEMFIHTIGPMIEMACRSCEKSYGCVLEYGLDLSDDTLKIAYEIWQEGACNQMGLEEIPCKYDEINR